MSARLTAVQRKVLGWLVKHGGSMPFAYGHKRTCLGTMRGNRAIGTAVNVVYPLEHNRKFITTARDKAKGYSVMTITEAGRAALTAAKGE